MFKIELDTKDFLKMKEMISKVFIDLPIEVHKDGYRIRNISQTKEVVITMDFDKNDMKGFEYDNKNNVFFNLPFGEFLDAVKKIKAPIEIGEEGTAKIYIKSEKITSTIDKQDVDKDLFTNHDAFLKQYTKKGTTKIIIGRGDFIDAVDQLSFSSSGVTMTVKDKKLTFESMKGVLSAKYEIDVDIDKSFEWTGAFNSLYMSMIKNLALYSKDVIFHVKEPGPDETLAVIVDLAVAPNSSVSLIMAGLKEGDTIDEEEEDESTEVAEEEDDFDFEEEETDNYYDEDEEF